MYRTQWNHTDLTDTRCGECDRRGCPGCSPARHIDDPAPEQQQAELLHGCADCGVRVMPDEWRCEPCAERQIAACGFTRELADARDQADLGIAVARGLLRTD